MAKFLIYSLLILICHTLALYSSGFPCLTWEINQERLKIICRIAGFSHPVSLMDSQGQLYGKCTFSRNVHYCIPVGRKYLIDVDYSRKTVVFNIGELHNSANGIWVCLQDNMRLTAQVSLSKGIIDSSEILITGSTRHTTKHVVTCFSCREPDGNNVEFLVNGRTEDSITYNQVTGSCTYHNGECHPDECSCNENMFQRVFQFELKNNIVLYTCEMLFTDSFTHAIFSKLVSVVFNGEGFYNKTTSTTIIKHGYTPWRGTLTTDQIVTESKPTRTTVTEILDKKKTEKNIPVEKRNGFPIPHLIAIIVACGAGCILVIFCVCRLIKRQHSISRHTITSTTLTEETTYLLRDNTISSSTMTEDNTISSSTMTEESYLLQDNTISSSTMTEESYLLQERSVFRRNESSNVTNLNTCDPCSFQWKERLAVFYCIDCEESLCANCSKNHKVMNQTRNHNNVSINKIPKKYSLPFTCTDHETMKHEYYCVDHECLCCMVCVSCHTEKVCQLEQIDDASKGFTKTQVFLDYDCQLNRYIDFLVDLSAYQYHMIDQMANSIANTFTKSRCDNDKEHCKEIEVDIKPITDLDDIKLRLNTYAKETCYILYSAGEQKGLFDFMKDNGSDRHLFILTHSLRSNLIEIDKRVSELVGQTKHAISYNKQSEEANSAKFLTIERELKKISFHRWRQSQTAVKDPALK